MAMVSMEIQMDDVLQKEAMAVYEKLGIDLPTAVRMFLRRSVLANGVPFYMNLPKDEEKIQRAVSAMKELSDASALNGVRSMTMEEINEEISAARREREAATKG